MSSILSILSTAQAGIAANTAAMNVTSQNVAGATTPGYVLRTAHLESVASGGVAVTGITRSFDRFSYGQLVDQQSKLSAAQARANGAADLETIVAPSSNTLSDGANDFLDALSQLATHPSDLSVRAAVLSSAQSLAQGFSSAANGITDLESELLTQASGTVSTLNQSLSQLSALDQQISNAQAQGGDASDLRDRRDELVGQIGQTIGGRVVEDAQGGITLFSAGTVLYQGGSAATVGVGLDANGALAITATRGGSTTDITSNVDTGTLGGIRESRDVDAANAQATLDQFAYDVSNAVNAVHQGGVGLDGVSGRPLFVVPSAVKGAAAAMALDPSVAGHPEAIAAASSSGTLPGGNDVAVALSNLGDATLGAGGTISERYGQLASDVGSAKDAADADVQTRQDTVATATSLRDSVSGVSTDEEMVKLQQFQQGFEASSKVMKTIDDLFDTLMSM